MMRDGRRKMRGRMIGCHGSKLLFGKSVGKSRVVGVQKRIFIPDLSQKIEDLGL